MPARPYPLRGRLAKLSVVDPDTGCWLWIGATGAAGYGTINMTYATCRSKNKGAHRVSYEEYVGPIPDGFVIDHLCRVRRCINPEHLEPVTQQENILRSPVRNGGPSTVCRRGHPYTEANAIYLEPSLHGFARRVCARCAGEILGRS